MNTEQQRADFEAWRKHAEEAGYDPDILDFIREGEGYTSPTRQAAWYGWRDGRAALKSQDREDARWLVFNVGCIECGVSSDVVGVFTSEEEAERVAAICNEALSWREGGQNSFEVFDLQSEQASEYSQAIDAAMEKQP